MHKITLVASLVAISLTGCSVRPNVELDPIMLSAKAVSSDKFEISFKIDKDNESLQLVAVAPLGSSVSLSKLTMLPPPDVKGCTLTTIKHLEVPAGQQVSFQVSTTTDIERCLIDKSNMPSNYNLVSLKRPENRTHSGISIGIPIAIDISYDIQGITYNEISAWQAVYKLN